jgi:protein-disulfide isomerase
VHYNLQVSNARISGHFVLAMLCAPLLMGGACEKKANKPNDTGAIGALDQAAATPGSDSAVAEAAVDTTPLAGVELGKLDADKTKLFYTLVGSLKSPCGKAHSLRTSITSDATCERAQFAVRYVLALLEDEASEQIARDEYAKKYEKPAGPPAKLDTSKAPHAGNDKPRIRLVEFFDYECPHCQLFKAMMDQVLADRGGLISASFMMFPLKQHTLARGAAQAALAAHQQGKFKEMHDKLFDPSQKPSHDNVISYAKGMGLDMAKFEKDYAAAASQIETDLAQGEAAGVDSTPTLFINDRKYEGPMYPKYIEMWIDEELVVNR